jgi:hypothetical protein
MTDRAEVSMWEGLKVAREASSATGRTAEPRRGTDKRDLPVSVQEREREGERRALRTQAGLRAELVGRPGAQCHFCFSFCFKSEFCLNLCIKI